MALHLHAAAGAHTAALFWVGLLRASHLMEDVWWWSEGAAALTSSYSQARALWQHIPRLRQTALPMLHSSSAFECISSLDGAGVESAADNVREGCPADDAITNGKGVCRVPGLRLWACP